MTNDRSSVTFPFNARSLHSITLQGTEPSRAEPLIADR
jgi:hypothetical protein